MKLSLVLHILLFLLMNVETISAQGTLPKPDHYRELEILDNEGNLIPDVNFSVNGHVATYDTVSSKYILRYKRSSEYHIIISHNDYNRVEVDGQRNIYKKYYLFKEGQSCRFDGELNYPIKSHPGLIFVTVPRGDSDKEQTQIMLKFKESLSKLNLKIHLEMDSFGLDGEDPPQGSKGEFYSRSYILAGKDSTLGSNAMRHVLSELRKEMKYAGPVLSNTDDLSDATFISNTIMVQFRDRSYADSTLVKIEEMGAKRKSQPYELVGKYQVELFYDFSSLDEMNKILEKIHSMDNIYTVGLAGYPFFIYSN